MAAVITYLKDAKTVAKFQRLCGIVRRSIPSVESHEDDGHCSSGYYEDVNGFPTVKKRSSSTLLGSTYVTATSTEQAHQSVDYEVTNRFLYYLFHFGANLGNEIFYMTFFPFWFWNIDGCVGRQLCTFWCIFMYLGQATKDIVKLPRPASPPVVQLEKRYVLEYGMPSTHAMVGAGIPFAIFFLTKERYIYTYELALVGAVVWCLLVSFSRIYLGMHSVLDVIVGLLYVASLMVVFLPYLGAIDHFLLYSPYAPVLCIAVPLILCVVYPATSEWSTARGDTVLILSAGSGVALGHWMSYQYGFMRKASLPPPYDIIPPTWTWAGLVVLRMTTGVVVLLILRQTVAAVMYRVACYVAGVDHTDRVAARQHLAVELMYKFVTYSTISIGMVYAAPAMFRALGIERETFFTEI